MPQSNLERINPRVRGLQERYISRVNLILPNWPYWQFSNPHLFTENNHS